MTKQELKIVRQLGEAWNEFMKLPEQHPMDRQEFCTAIHRCQEKVLARPAIRAMRTASK